MKIPMEKRVDRYDVEWKTVEARGDILEVVPSFRYATITIHELWSIGHIIFPKEPLKVEVYFSDEKDEDQSALVAYDFGMDDRISTKKENNWLYNAPVRHEPKNGESNETAETYDLSRPLPAAVDAKIRAAMSALTPSELQAQSVRCSVADCSSPVSNAEILRVVKALENNAITRDSIAGEHLQQQCRTEASALRYCANVLKRHSEYIRRQVEHSTERQPDSNYGGPNEEVEPIKTVFSSIKFDLMHAFFHYKGDPNYGHIHWALLGHLDKRVTADDSFLYEDDV